MTRLTKEQKQSIADRLEGGQSLRSLATEWGVTFQTLQYHRRRLGLPLMRPARTSGKDHASWRGGSYVDRFGYLMVLAPERGKVNKYVPEHLLLAEAALGRRLRRGEMVHHIDGDKTNNSPENLFPCTHSVHKKAHHQLEGIAQRLFRKGLIRWTGTDYELVE